MNKMFLKAVVGLAFMASFAAHADYGPLVGGLYKEDVASGSRLYFFYPEPTYVDRNGNVSIVDSLWDLKTFGNGVAGITNKTSSGLKSNVWTYLITDGVDVGIHSTNALWSNASDGAECYGYLTAFYYPYISYRCDGAASGAFLRTGLVTDLLKGSRNSFELEIDSLGFENEIKNALLLLMPQEQINAYYSTIGKVWGLHGMQGADILLELRRIPGSVTSTVVRLQGLRNEFDSRARARVLPGAYPADIKQCANISTGDLPYCGGRARSY